MTRRVCGVAAFTMLLLAAHVRAQDASQLLGSWESRSEFGAVSLVFTSNSALEFDGERYRYEERDGVIRIADGYGYEDYAYSIEGDRLVVGFPDGTVLEFTRLAASKRDRNPAATRDDGQGAGGQAGSELAAHFAGLWVTWTSNTETKNYLMADGRFFQNYEASYSGSSSDQYGNETMSWGQGGQQSESGRWSVRGTREEGVLTITYPDGSTTAVRYQVHRENGQTYWNEYLFDGVLYAKQRE